MCSPADTRIRASKFLQRHRQVSLGFRYSSPKQGSGNILLLLLFWASFSHGKNIYCKEPAPVQWSPPGSHEGGSAGPGKCSHKSLNLEQQFTEQTRDSMSSNTWRDRFQGLLTPGRLQNAAEHWVPGQGPVGVGLLVSSASRQLQGFCLLSFLWGSSETGNPRSGAQQKLVEWRAAKV
jgi:hypothetical protein